MSGDRALQDGGGITKEDTLSLVDSIVTENMARFGAGLSSLGSTEFVCSATSNNTSTELTGLRPDGRDCERRRDRTLNLLCVGS